MTLQSTADLYPYEYGMMLEGDATPSHITPVHKTLRAVKPALDLQARRRGSSHSYRIVRRAMGELDWEDAP